jgi:biopolymer transport protein ExbD
MNNVRPAINVTPLIDVLLVLLIIFMVIAPAKPTDFKAKIPQEPTLDGEIKPNPDTLVVALNADSTLRLNNDANVGTVDAPEKLVASLAEIFRKRAENGDFAESLAARRDLNAWEKTERTVFIKAPRAVDYGRVARAIDAVKTAGASPISLQIDDLD